MRSVGLGEGGVCISGKVEQVTKDLKFILSTEVYRSGNIVFEVQNFLLFRNNFK